MTFSFRPAIRESTPVLIALAGPSGGGKTYSAMRLARGLVGPAGKIAFIDTEARRALHYAGKFKFDHGELAPPFTPESYRAAVEAAEKHVGTNGAIVIDSATHEWSGDGGCQDIHDESIQKMVGDEPDMKKRAAKMERLSALGWRDAKMRHKRMMSRLLQCRAHLIFCLRAEEKIKFEKVEKTGDNGRTYTTTAIVPIGWQPLCEKNFMFEMTASFMLSDLVKHLPTAIKLQDQHAPFFPLDKPIDEKAGELLAAWAKGGVAVAPAPKAETPPAEQPHDPNTGEVKTENPMSPEYIAAEQWANSTIKKMDTVTSAEFLDAWLDKNRDKLASVRAVHAEAAMSVIDAADKRKKQLNQGVAA